MIQYRGAIFADVEALHGLLNGYAAAGLMLSRSRNSIYENLRDYIVAVDMGKVVGVGALHMVWDKLAEVRSLAVVNERKKQNIGREIVCRLETGGRLLGAETFFALTYQPGFFAKCGYRQVPNDSLPQKVWKECVYCPKYPYCDEIAMIKHN
ncbi:MAG: N-acetyltransferase [Acidaminococcales bacterium]|jgi:amino-acid N-acetyltransferase|nr:N-acetyltransferase [Acidaminococcales bacterium]